MHHQDGTIKERVPFLAQEPDALRGIRGRDLYEQLNNLGLTHNQYFRAMDTNVQEYCAQEFGVDMSRITVERFFQSDPNAKWLFPEIVRESVLTGMQRKPMYPDLIIRDEHISGSAYDVPYVDESAENEELRTVAEGAVIPESKITYGDRVVKLDKKGRGILASYEVIRRMSVDMLRVHLQRIGERLGRNLDARLANALVYGDLSSGNTAPVTLNTSTADTWTYADLVKGFMKLTQEHYFTPTHMLADSNTAQAILGLSEFSDSTLFDFAKTGNLPTPLGVKLVPMPDQPADKLTILDAGYAIQKLTEQDLLVESDKLINQQWDRTYLTVVTDFAVIYDKARVVLDSDWV
jgi:HK97 family phage major capsid protein